MKYRPSLSQEDFNWIMSQLNNLTQYQKDSKKALYVYLESYAEKMSSGALAPTSTYQKLENPLKNADTFAVSPEKMPDLVLSKEDQERKDRGFSSLDEEIDFYNGVKL